MTNGFFNSRSFETRQKTMQTTKQRMAADPRVNPVLRKESLSPAELIEGYRHASKAEKASPKPSPAIASSGVGAGNLFTRPAVTIVPSGRKSIRA